jgi:hypothetical protein
MPSVKLQQQAILGKNVKPQRLLNYEPLVLDFDEALIDRSDLAEESWPAPGSGVRLNSGLTNRLVRDSMSAVSGLGSPRLDLGGEKRKDCL